MSKATVLFIVTLGLMIGSILCGTFILGPAIAHAQTKTSATWLGYLPHQSDLWQISTENHKDCTWGKDPNSDGSDWYLEFEIKPGGARPVMTALTAWGRSYPSPGNHAIFITGFWYMDGGGNWWPWRDAPADYTTQECNGILLPVGKYRIGFVFNQYVTYQGWVVWPVDDPEQVIAQYGLFAVGPRGYWSQP